MHQASFRRRQQATLHQLDESEAKAPTEFIPKMLNAAGLGWSVVEKETRPDFYSTTKLDRLLRSARVKLAIPQELDEEVEGGDGAPLL